MKIGFDYPVTFVRKGENCMVNRDMFGELEDLKIEVDEVFRSAGYIRPAGDTCLALSTTRHFPHSTFRMEDRIINMSSYLQ